MQWIPVISCMDSAVVANKSVVLTEQQKQMHVIRQLAAKPALLENKEAITYLLQLPIPTLQVVVSGNFIPQFTQHFITQSNDSQFLQVLKNNDLLFERAEVKLRLYSMDCQTIAHFIAQTNDETMLQSLASTLPKTIYQQLLLYDEISQNDVLYVALKRGQDERLINKSIMRKVMTVPMQLAQLIWTIIDKMICYKYGTERVSEPLEQIIKSFAQQMGYQQNFVIRRVNSDENEALAFTVGRYLYINETAIRNRSKEEARFIIGHELAHMIHEHSLQRLICTSAYAALSALDFYTLYRCERKVIQGQGINNSRLEELAQAAAHWLASGLAKSQIRKYNQRVIHAQELEADRTAADRLNAQDGAIEFFQNESVKKGVGISSTHPTPHARMANLMSPYVLLLQKQDSGEIIPIPMLESPVAAAFIFPAIIGSSTTAAKVVAVTKAAAFAYGCVYVGNEIAAAISHYWGSSIAHNKKKGNSKEQKKEEKKDNKEQKLDNQKDPKDPKDPKKGSDQRINPEEKKKEGRSDRSKSKDRGPAKERHTETVSKAKFKDTALGKAFEQHAVRKVENGEVIYIIKEKIKDFPNFKKGDRVRHDLLHDNHLEVSNAQDVQRCVVDMKGEILLGKTMRAIGRRYK